MPEQESWARERAIGVLLVIVVLGAWLSGHVGGQVDQAYDGTASVVQRVLPGAK